jgi:AcrR family transcriptional regulator
MPKHCKNRGDLTRQALILAAIEIFGRDGFHAASTREIARRAEANQAAIGYHFGGKDGLYLAAIKYIAEQIGERIGPVTRDIAMKLEGLERQKTDPAKVREKSIALLLQLMDGLLSMLISEESSSWARIILQEQQAPSAAFDIFYKEMMSLVLQMITALVGKIREIDPQLEEARLLAIMVFGQVIVLRTSRAAILRYMEWSDFSAKQADIKAQIHHNIIAILMHGNDL